MNQAPPTRRRGQSLVEFALILPVVTLLILGGIDLARLYHTRVILANASRAAAAFGTNWNLINTQGGASAAETLVKNVAKNEALPYVTLNTVTFKAMDGVSPPSWIAGERFVITVSTTFSPVTPMISQIWGGGGLTMSHTTQLRFNCAAALPCDYPTPTPFPTATPFPTPTPPPTPTNTATPTVTQTPTNTVTPTPGDTPTPTITPTPGDTPTPTITPTVGDTPTPTITPTVGDTPTPTITPTVTPTLTPCLPIGNDLTYSVNTSGGGSSRIVTIGNIRATNAVRARLQWGARNGAAGDYYLTLNDPSSGTKTPPATFSFTITGLQAGTYHFNVTAFDACIPGGSVQSGDRTVNP